MTVTEIADTADRTLRTGTDLARAGLIDAAGAAAADAVAARYAVAVTPHLARRIAAAGGAGPLARQFLPDAAELDGAPGERADPIGDAAHSPLPGIVHRHRDRVLLMPLLTCPVYCRFCFRRAAVGPDGGMLAADALAAALAYIESHGEIWEVILSGGDPLMLSDRRLAYILERLDAIAHVATVRIHSRVPVAEPSRITEGLAALLDRATPVHLVLHCNHADELTPAACAALRTLARAGVPLMAQTVLLRGVNDDADTLEALMRALVRNRVRPYYLHHPDPAPGTGHFRVPVAAGQALMRELRARASGLCQPTYVLDIPGGYGKVPVGPAYLSDDGTTVADPAGRSHRYGAAAAR